MLLRRRRRNSEFSAFGRFRRWSRHEDMIAGRFVRELLRGQYPSAVAAAQACAREMVRQRQKHRNWIWPPSPRSLPGVTARLIKLAHARDEVWSGAWWSKEEENTLAPFADGLANGRYRNSVEAARVCSRELVRQRRLHPELPWLGERKVLAIQARLGEMAGRLGWRPEIPPRAPQERRLIYIYARALARGKYPTAEAAAQGYLAEVARLRRRFPRTRWLSVQRRLHAVTDVIRSRAHELGRRTPPRWSAEELRLLRRFARGAMHGRYPSQTHAADEFVAEANRRRAAAPSSTEWAVSRSQKASRAELVRMTRKMGWVPKDDRWSDDELNVVAKYARLMAAGRYRTARAAARVALDEVNRMLKTHPDPRRALIRRRLDKTETRLVRQAHKFGAIWGRTHWSRAEDAVARKYARAVVAGQYTNAVPAAGECLKELGRHHKLFLAAHPDLPRSPQPRNLDCVHRRVVAHARALRGVKLTWFSERSPHPPGPSA